MDLINIRVFNLKYISMWHIFYEIQEE